MQNLHKWESSKSQPDHVSDLDIAVNCWVYWLIHFNPSTVSKFAVRAGTKGIIVCSKVISL